MRISLPLVFALLAPLPTIAQETWREPLTGVEFVRMPAGCYVMGDTFGKGEANEQPPHEVCLKSYWIGRYEVTQGEWQKAVSVNPSAYVGSDRLPVDSVNQMDIAGFIFRLSAANPGRTFRLPTEAEWEYACRAAGQQAMFGGQPPPAGANTAEYAERHGEGTVPAGRFPPNKMGLHDMCGDLWEWVFDIYAPDAYRRHNRDNPRHVADGPACLLRGGSWSHAAGFSRCSKRHMHCRPTARFDFVGFRRVPKTE